MNIAVRISQSIPAARPFSNNLGKCEGLFANFPRQIAKCADCLPTNNALSSPKGMEFVSRHYALRSRSEVHSVWSLSR